VLHRLPGGKRTVRQANDAGWRPLRIASQHDQVAACVWLIAHGAVDEAFNGDDGGDDGGDDDGDEAATAPGASSKGAGGGSGVKGRRTAGGERVSLEVVLADLPGGALGSGPALPLGAPRNSPFRPAAAAAAAATAAAAAVRRRQGGASQRGGGSVRARVASAAAEVLELHAVFVLGFVLGACARSSCDADGGRLVARRVALRAEVSGAGGPVRLVASYLFEHGWPLGPGLARLRSFLRVVAADDDARQAAAAPALATAEPGGAGALADGRSDKGALGAAGGCGGGEFEAPPSVPRLLGSSLAALASASATLASASFSASSTAAAFASPPSATVKAAQAAATAAAAMVVFRSAAEDGAAAALPMPSHASFVAARALGAHLDASLAAPDRLSRPSTEPFSGDSGGCSVRRSGEVAEVRWPAWGATAAVVLAAAVALSLAALLPADQRRQRRRL
jgi:hypothetical protein